MEKTSALMLVLLLAGCAVEFQNRQPAEELAKASRPAGSVYTGWRVFQDRCARCHGPDASGTAAAPDLLPRMRELGPRQFVNLVLRRYEWSLPSRADDAMVEDILQRRAGALIMPAWAGEPVVGAHIADLHAYLAARGDGTLPPGRPSP